MNLYLDDDLASPILASLLRQAGHDARLPRDVGLQGEHDAVHLTHCIRNSRVCVTRDHDDFKKLHDLVIEAQGHHPGILVVRREKNPKRNMKHPDVVRAIANLESAGFSLTDNYQTLNHWR